MDEIYVKKIDIFLKIICLAQSLPVYRHIDFDKRNQFSHGSLHFIHSQNL